MSRRDQNEKVFKSVQYWRILKFVKPYWVRLAVGLIAGLIVGGSLFGSLMLVPNMVMIADGGTVMDSKQYSEQSEKILSTLEAAPDASRDERARMIYSIIEPEKDNDPKLTKAMNSLRDYQEKFHLPVEVGKRDVTLLWPDRRTLPIVDAAGRMTWQFFSIYAVLFIIAWALKSLATYINHYYMRWVSSRVIADMRNLLYKKLLSQSMKFFGHQDVGHLISRCTNDTAMIESSISDVIADLTRCPIEIAACLIAMIIMCIEQNMFGMLGAALCIPAIMVPVLILARKIRQSYRHAFAHIAELTSRMHETFSGILLVKTSHTETCEVRRFKLINGSYFRVIVRALSMKLMMAPLMEFTSVSVALCFLIFAYRNGFSVSQMAMLLTPVLLAYQPLKTLTKVINNLQRSMAAADRYFDLIDTDTSLFEKPDAIVLKDFRSGIEFRNVSFGYEPGHDVLKNVSFKLPCGSMVAVVGETGSGKTTMASLLSRLYDATGGEVLIDGHSVADYTISSLRSKIGIVTQEPIIFNDTIAKNIAYSTLGASKDEIVNAAKHANAHDFIVSGTHPLGYEEEAGEKGCKLSGGEKQRIALARIMLKNPPILVLDEATSALDTVTEKIIQDALAKVMKNRTVFAIAHRLSTIRNADLILVMDHGEIVERGTHDELLAQGGLYRKLHDTQFSMDRD